MKKVKKVKKVIGWIVLAIIVGGVSSVPIIEMGWGDGLIICAIILALFGILYWAVNAITGE